MFAGLIQRALLNSTIVASGPTLGPELAINGDFSSATGWTQDAGWSVSGGIATGTNTANFLYESGITGIVAGHTYRCVYTVVSSTGGRIKIYLGSGVFSGTIRTGPGTYSEDITPTSGGEFGFQGLTDGTNFFSGVLDDVSIKEIL